MSFFWTAAIVAGGAVIGGVVSAQGAQSAAQTQSGAQMQAAQIGENEFNTITGQETPYMQSGYGAQSALNYYLGIGGSAPGGSALGSGPGSGNTAHAASGGKPGAGATSYPGGVQSNGAPSAYGSLLAPFTAQNFQQLSPAYQFQQQQGMQGVLNGDTSGSGAESGAASKDLINYNQNLANTSFNNAFNQYQTQQGNIYSRLAGIAQQGQNAAANTGYQGTSLAENIGQSVASAGAASAAGTVGAANAYSGALSSAAPWLAYGGGGAPAGWGVGGQSGNLNYQQQVAAGF